MADNQSSLNENLIAAGLNTGNPTSTYVDFAEQIAKNQVEQAQQEQTLALAKQHVAQATLQTKQQTEADQAGVNPELLNVMPKDQALAQIKLLIQTKGLPLDEKSLQSLADTLPAMVPASQVEVFASRFARAYVKQGQPTEISTDQIIKVPSGKSAADLGLVYDGSTKMDDKDASDGTKTAHVPDDGMYQVAIDEAGNVIRYTLGGKEPVDPSIKAGQHSEDQNRKDWIKLGVQIDTAFRTRSGGLGSLITAIYRADRALNTLNSAGTFTAQDIANVSQDIAGIYQGGAPTVESARANDYETIFTNLANMVRHITGAIISVNSPIDETRKKLIDTVTTLRESSIENFSKWMDSQAHVFKAVIATDPAQWEDIKKDKLAAVTSGLVLTPDEKAKAQLSGADISIAPKSAFKKVVGAVKGALGGAKAQTVPKYTVEN